jgi:APA family basic amino acid/polyamine antiporter
MRTLTSALILIATTIGAGMFALPYVFYNSGWAAILIYFFILGALMIFIHYFYAQVLLKNNQSNLLQLIYEKSSSTQKFLAFIVIWLGLILTLVAYLILGGNFLKIIFNNLGENLAVLIFWLICSISLIKRNFFASYESLGTFFMFLIIAVLFIFSLKVNLTNFSIPIFNLNQLFLPFGATLFSFAGWTGINSMKNYINNKNEFKKAIILGTIIVILLYALFILSIFKLSFKITPDALSGLSLSNKLIINFLAILGLFAIWTSYLPIFMEALKSLENKLSFKTSFFILMFLPLVFFSFGAKSFLGLISFTGGVFLSGQYIFILNLIRKTLITKKIFQILIIFLNLLFLGAIFYEIYFFIIKK